ncbi:divergent polysaccharide deacetylase family protein [Pontivivens insulae]|uniref:Divergent polysaccharide deacetylase n=1 Tax=Pontivivens insulae TaxID=1639689 RepID=A0A2R8AB90_9RHOB|nr:divergent polysaccharide deacetylase family protein [Pontivivens insulae]RED13228.1 polysaccharide deacetylase 2 family uncharacterized protein YibQ [Pontivivens insulae]SPF29320.1 hypothetical protein POI8812_01628 [Pontivivens insulae]
MAQGSGISFISGFVGGGLLSGLVLGAVSIAVPLPATEQVAREDVAAAAPDAEPEQEEASSTPRLEVTDRDVTVAPAPETTTARPAATSVPTGLSTAPAVDPDLPQTEIALAPVEDVDEAVANRSGAPRPAAPTVDDPLRSAALETPTGTDLGGLSTDNPERVRAPVREPTSGLGAPAPTEQATVSPSLPATTPSVEPTRPTPGLITARGSELIRGSIPDVDSADPPPAPFELPDVAPAVEAVPDSQRPVLVNAAPFEDDRSRPLLAVVLIDDGTSENIAGALTAVSLPVTFALAADLPNVEERANAYRASGFEVLALMPDDLAEDLETLELDAFNRRIAGVLASVPGAVGLMDREGGVLSANAGVGSAAVDYLALSGHALLVHPRMGLTQLDQVARSSGVPSVAVGRDVSTAEGALAVGSTLRRSAVDARSNGTSVVVGSINDTTLSTIVTWALATENRTVALSPLTAVLNRVGL